MVQFTKIGNTFLPLCDLCGLCGKKFIADILKLKEMESLIIPSRYST